MWVTRTVLRDDKFERQSANCQLNQGGNSVHPFRRPGGRVRRWVP